MNLKAIIFDFGGVLCFHPSQQQLDEAALFCGVTTEQFVDAFWRDRLEYDRGQEPHAYWKSVAGILRTSFDETAIAGLIRREVDFWSNFDQRVLNWTRQLRQAGIKTGILSNLPIPLGQRLREISGFLEHFDQVTFSCELHSAKPESAIYEHSIAGLGIAPEEALFLDDRPVNIEGARAVGLEADLYQSWEAFLESDLPRRNLPRPQ